MAKENVKVEDVVFDEDVVLEEKGDVNMKKNWKTYTKYAIGAVAVIGTGLLIYKWRKSKKASTTAVVVATPSVDNSVTDEAVAPNTTVVQI